MLLILNYNSLPRPFYHKYHSILTYSPRHNYEYDDNEFDRYSSNGMAGNKIRRAPPPPPPVHKNLEETSPYYESDTLTDYGDGNDKIISGNHGRQANAGESGRDFENFKVTIKNSRNRRHQNFEKFSTKNKMQSLEGTPSLSGVEDEDDDDVEDSYYDDTIDEDSEDEESKERRQRHRRGGGGEDDMSDEKMSMSPPHQPIIRKKGSIKDRLGHKVPVRPPSPPDTPPKRQRIAPPLTPPNKKRSPPRSSKIQQSRRPPSPSSLLSDENYVGKDEIEPRPKSKVVKKSFDTRSGIKHKGISSGESSSRKQRGKQAHDVSKRKSRSPITNRIGNNRRNTRSWSTGKENLGSRYGNRSPTPLPGTPRRVREQRAKEAADIRAKENEANKKEKSKKSNPIYGKSKMRMDRRDNVQRECSDRSSDTVDEENSERPNRRKARSRTRKDPKRERHKSWDSRSSSKRDKARLIDHTRSRNTSGGFGKGVIVKNRRNRNTSSSNRPPTPVPIGSKSRNKISGINKDKSRMTIKDKESAAKIKNQNTDKTSKENEVMLQRLARKRRGKPQSSESNKNHNLAKIAGLEIPKGTSGLESPKEIGHNKEVNVKSVSDARKSHSSDRGSDISNDNYSNSRSGSGTPPRRKRRREWKSSRNPEKSSNSKKNIKNKNRNIGQTESNKKLKKSKEGSSDSRDDEARHRSRSRSKGVRNAKVLVFKQSKEACAT